jgi:hypothetical protein
MSNIYNTILELFKNRRTVRLASETDISEDNLIKILDAAKTAPSFDKLYPYKIYVLTNSAEGRLKKEQLLEYFRCGTDRPFTSWSNKEMLQPILSGIVLVYTYWVAPPITPDPLTPLTNSYGAIDAIMGATMTLLAAESLGLATSFLVCAKEKIQASIDITGNPDERMVAIVTISNENLGSHAQPTMTIDGDAVVDYTYNEQTAYVRLNKHHKIKNSVTIQEI